MSPSRPKIIYGPLISPLSKRDIRLSPCSLLSVSSCGVIEWAEHDVDPSSLQEVLAKHGRSLEDRDVEFIQLKWGEWIMPGFVDTHTHAPQFQNNGAGSQYELLDWLKYVTFPEEEKFADVQYAKKMYRRVVRASLDLGTTMCCWYGTLHLEGTKVLADITHELGQRAYVGKCNMDRNSSPTYQEASAEESIADTRSFISYVEALSPSDSTALVRPIITPRFAISCTSKLLTGLGELAAAHPQVPIQTHISENNAEIAYTKTLFPECSTYAEVYDHFGLLRENTILAHGVHLEKSELDLIKRRGAGLSHCPTSNFNLRSGSAHVGQWLDNGNKCGLGTDCSGGWTASMITAMQLASVCSKVVSFYTKGDDATLTGRFSKTQFAKYQLPIPTLFWIATMGGAEVCCLQDTIGSLEPGKQFDAVRVSILPETENMHLWYEESDSLESMLERFMTNGDERNVREVWVKGRKVGGRLFK
ncbi:Metallo-dependent hydrolase [Dacryopinax primogenitus]|uniref:Guanine deaminase n=1 Tax=Dacryopinax primogenitus (strain DJM 731) TaxID=1858805 RepID=M5G9T2_DACPD|nr:Metallo-dependent hydrolase [Dacryopinax primogenitus]EJU00593.1 Metallo-dependent hydrolase [Dacryopinax primogenitus]